MVGFPDTSSIVILVCGVSSLLLLVCVVEFDILLSVTTNVCHGFEKIDIFGIHISAVF